jgi:hypothetical protein
MQFADFEQRQHVVCGDCRIKPTIDAAGSVGPRLRADLCQVRGQRECKECRESEGEVVTEFCS